MAMADITVRGAGAFGLTIAWVCAQRGAKVQVVDPFGAASGSSGGLVGALAPHVPENWNHKKAFQLDSLLMAEDFWAGIEAAGGVPSSYGRTGRLQPIKDDKALALALRRAETSRDLWRGEAEWSVCKVSDLGSWTPPSATGYVIHDTLAARMSPRRAADSLIAGLAVLGVQVVPDAPDQGQVVHAKGFAGLQELNAELGKTVGGGVKGQSAVLRFDAGDVPQIFADNLYMVPHSDGTLAIGSTSEREFDAPYETDELLEDVIERIRTLMPVLHGAEVIDRWAGVRPRAKTRSPMLGAYPNRPGHFIANGGFKIGFGMAPKVAHVMADLLLDGVDAIPDGFRVEDNL